MSDWQKPGLEEWVTLAGDAVERLSGCVHIYNKPPNPDVFMSESERQKKREPVLALLKKIHAQVDHAESSVDSGQDEKIILALGDLFQETLRLLPPLSNDMQTLLKSSWMSHFPSPTAQKLFQGTDARQMGIGSGQPEHGRLPAALAEIVERETLGERRGSRGQASIEELPKRNDPDDAKRWVKANSKHLRSAGRIE